MRVGRAFLVTVFLAGLSVVGVPRDASSQNIFKVTRVDDPAPGACTSDCSLREAIGAANLAGEGLVWLGGSGESHKLTRAGDNEDGNSTGDLDVTGDLTIAGQPSAIEQFTQDRVFHVHNGGSLVLFNLTVTGGDATSIGGGVLAAGPLSMVSVTVKGNLSTGSGGGVYTTAETFIARSTISGNTSGGNGGALRSGANLVVEDSTFSSNSAFLSGGGLQVSNGIAHLNFVTITRNEADEDDDATGDGGGISRLGGTLNVSSSVIVDNDDGNGAGASIPSDCDGTVQSGGYNVLSTVAGCSGIVNGVSEDEVTSSHGLATALADNGGPTFTHRLLNLFSPIRNNVPSDVCTSTFDQRGAERTDETCDSGAYEERFCGTRVVNVVGSSRSETLVGTTGNDGILGGKGNDLIVGAGGADAMCGEGGNDEIQGHEGDDQHIGGGGKDKCFGGPGADTFRGCEKKKQEG